MSFLTKFLSGSFGVGLEPPGSASCPSCSGQQPAWVRALLCYSRQHLQAFQKQSCSRPAVVWTSSFIVQDSLLASFDSGRERVSWCLSPRKGFLGLGLSGTTPILCCHLQKLGFVSSFSFVLLASPAGQGLAWSQHFWTPHPAAAQQWHWGQLVAMICLLHPSLTAAGLWVVKTSSFSSLRWELPAAILYSFLPFLWESWILRMSAACEVS